MSKRTATPTDYLQINNKEKLFGEKKFMLIYNETKDAIITFRTDLFFNKKGFLLYYKGKLGGYDLVLTFKYESISL